MKKITKFEYMGQLVSFEFEDGSRMVNATEMAKPFKKKVGHFLSNKQTKEFISVLEDRNRNPDIGDKHEIIRVVKGGNPELQGTWMNEKLALKFAAWLEAKFEVWVYDRIHELLTTGEVKLPNYRPTSEVVKSLRLIADQLEFHDRQIGEIKEDIHEMKDHISNLEAKIISIDENYYSISGYCALNNLACPLDKAKKWGLTATRESRKQRVAIGKAYDAKYGEINTYHIDILKKVVI